MTRRSFIKKGAVITAVSASGIAGVAGGVFAKSKDYATLIDLTKCDGCKNVGTPKCVEACKQANRSKFPEPEHPIKDLWPQKTHDDWSQKRDVIDTLTPYNWTTVQKVEVDGEEIYLPRRCMHCDKPPCANLCPFGALNKHGEAPVVINHNLCMGGAKCKSVCPWHIPQRQSGVGVYMKLQPMPAGGGVMYKCDLCHDRLRKGQVPACVEACEKRLGNNKPLYFGERVEILRIARERASEINGFIYGEKENGGTATIYVSRVPFEKIHSRLAESKSKLLLEKVENPLRDANRWAKGFLIGPIVGALGAIGLAFHEKKQRPKASVKPDQPRRTPHENKKEEK